MRNIREEKNTKKSARSPHIVIVIIHWYGEFMQVGT